MSRAEIQIKIKQFEADVKAGKYDAPPVMVDLRKVRKTAGNGSK